MKSGTPSRTTAAHKTQTKIQAWSSLVFHCRHSSFNPSEAPPWDSRPVSGAGVVHYHLLHRPRSVPTALGPAPLATIINAFIDTFDQFIASMVNRSLPPLLNLSYRKLLNGSVLKFPQKILRSKNCF